VAQVCEGYKVTVQRQAGFVCLPQALCRRARAGSALCRNAGLTALVRIPTGRTRHHPSVWTVVPSLTAVPFLHKSHPDDGVEEALAAGGSHNHDAHE
jgi:hypothetical protein